MRVGALGFLHIFGLKKGFVAYDVAESDRPVIFDIASKKLKIAALLPCLVNDEVG